MLRGGGADLASDDKQGAHRVINVVIRIFSFYPMVTNAGAHFRGNFKPIETW